MTMSEQPEGGGFDLSALLEQAQAMQAKLQEAQAEVQSQVVEGQSGGGAVRIKATGGLQFTEVTIDPSAVDPDDVEMLQDLVLAAISDTVAKANELNADAMGGLGLPGLGG